MAKTIEELLNDLLRAAEDGEESEVNTARWAIIRHVRGLEEWKEEAISTLISSGRMLGALTLSPEQAKIMLCFAEGKSVEYEVSVMREIAKKLRLQARMPETSEAETKNDCNDEVSLI